MLGVAFRRYAGEEEAGLGAERGPPKDLVFAGVFAFQDPPKPGVADAITVLKEANLRVFMVTGDHAETAQSLARHLGILHKTTEDFEEDNDLAAVITGTNLRGLSAAQWENVLKKQEVLFARVSPEEKQLVVRRFQEQGRRVVMVGDGANDTLALRQADVGIVLGRNCSALSQDVADLIFRDEDFARVVLCVRQARIFFDNLKKVVAYTLAHCILEVMPCFLAAALHIPPALSSVQMLMIDLGTEVLPAISLAFLQPRANVMDRQPRDPARESLVSWRILLHSYVLVGGLELIWCFFAYFAGFALTNVSPECRVPLAEFAEAVGAQHFQPSGHNEAFGRGCSSGQQKQVLAQVQTAWFVTAVLGQFSNVLLMVGARQVWTWVAVALELGLLVLMVGVRAWNRAFFFQDSEREIVYNPALALTPWLGSLLLLLLYYRARKHVLSRRMSGRVAAFFNW